MLKSVRNRCAPARTNENRTTDRKVQAAMELLVIFFILLVFLAALLGWTSDSRDSADWRPTERGIPGQW